MSHNGLDIEVYNLRPADLHDDDHNHDDHDHNHNHYYYYSSKPNFCVEEMANLCNSAVCRTRAAPGFLMCGGSVGLWGQRQGLGGQ